MDMRPPHNGSETSRLAADSIVTEAATLRLQVLQALASADNGLTREELQDVLSLKGDTLRPRVWELLKAGSIRVDPDQRRKTRGGRQAEVLTFF